MSLRILLFVFEAIYKLMAFISSLLKGIPLPRIWDSYPNYGFKSVFAFGHVRFMKLFPPIKEISSTTYVLEAILGMSSLFRQEGLFDFNLFNKKLVILVDPDLIKVVLTSSKEINKPDLYKMFHIFLGRGLRGKPLEETEEIAKSDVSSPEHQGIRSHKYVKVMISQFQEDISKSDSKILDIAESIEKRAFYIIADAAGFDEDYQRNEYLGDFFFKAIKSLEESYSHRLIRPWLQSDNIYKMTAKGKETVNAVKVIDETFETVMMKKKANMKEPDDNVRSVNFADIILQMLDKNPELMSDKQFRDEFITIIGAGFDTSATLTIFTLYMIGLYPEIQENVYQELTSICGTDTERDIEYTDFKHLTYLEKVTKESLRLCPPLPLIARELTEDLQIGEKALKKGATCLFSIQGVHRDPRYFPNPEVFNPDRFNPENSEGRHPFCYIPFAAGPRNCIGQPFAAIELKVFLANVLRHFRITSQLPRDKVIPGYGIVSKIHEMPLHFVPRNQNN